MYPCSVHSQLRHWNTIEVDGSIPEDELLEMIDHSYAQVVKGLTKAERAQLNSATSGETDR